MFQTAERYARWKAPSEDGQLLIWPAPVEIIADTRRNQRGLSVEETARIQGIPLNEARSCMRRWLAHDDSQPLIATGHQAELHHPGVWAKNILIDAVARKLDGRAFHFSVDSDEPKHLQLRWPGGAVALTDDPNEQRAEWSGLVQPPSASHLKEVESTFEHAAARWSFTPAAFDFLRSLRRRLLNFAMLPAMLSDCLQELDWELGLRYDAMIASPIWMAEPYLLFAYHVLARAGTFAADYNAALGEFRRDNKIRDPGRPMPNLRIDPDSCEVPFWLDSLSAGSRKRALVRNVKGRFLLDAADGSAFEFDQAAEGWQAAESLGRWLRSQNLRLAPRALTLTAILRLLVADQFVHGIGGGQYDQVLDALTARHFQIDPPRFAVTTATLFFPQAVGMERACVPCLQQEGHRLRHSLLGDGKRQMLDQIGSLPRHSRERAEVFQQMHQQLHQSITRPEFADWKSRFDDASRKAAEQRVLFDRELFYAIQPRRRLAGLVNRYRERF